MTLNLLNLVIACITCVIVCNFRLALLIPRDPTFPDEDDDDDDEEDNDDDDDDDKGDNEDELEAEALTRLPL